MFLPAFILVVLGLFALFGAIAALMILHHTVIAWLDRNALRWRVQGARMPYWRRRVARWWYLRPPQTLA